MKLPPSFYISEDPLSIAKNLLGCFLFTNIDQQLTGGKIIEVEAYLGAQDKACHAYNMRKTKRTQAMFEEGGISYIYLCYGMHHLLNVVTGPKDNPTAVLIRALEPSHGIQHMLKRRKYLPKEKIANGPGALTKALGITKNHNTLSFQSNVLWIEERKEDIEKIQVSPRIGVAYAEEDALLPYRFMIS